MSSKERIIAYSIIFILLSTLVYFVFLGDSKYVEDYNLKIDALEAKVDSLHHINDDELLKFFTDRYRKIDSTESTNSEARN